MRAFAQRQNQARRPSSPEREKSPAPLPPKSQRPHGDTHARPDGLRGDAASRFEHDFSRVPASREATTPALQAKLTVNSPGDAYEQEADRVAERLTGAQDSPRGCACGGGCNQCQAGRVSGERLQTKRVEPFGSEQTAVPASVHEALSSPGRPLGESARSFMEPRFGHDFSRVRVHTDAKAAESARELNARAYTVGRDIVFGAGLFLPETPAGRRLLSHELTHVIQQRHAPDSARPSLQMDRQPGAGTPTPPRTTPATPAPTPAPTTPAVRPLDYDRTVIPVPVLLPGQTTANLTARLNQKVSNGELASFSVKGVPRGSRQEMFLLGVIVQLGVQKRWGTEADLVTAIDWPPRPGAPAPQGRVTLRISPQGAAVAELIGAGPFPAIPQATFADGTARLKSDFGFASVTGWSNTAQGTAEINDVLAALDLLKSHALQDLPALNGVDLIRVVSLGPDTDGQFTVAPARTPGSTGPTRSKLELANGAFNKDDLQFFGGGPASPPVPSSFQTILHEVGHAVEKEQYRAAQEAVFQAEAAQEVTQQAKADFGTKLDEDLRKARNQRARRRIQDRAVGDFKRLEAADDAARANVITAANARSATRVPAAVAQPFVTEAANKKSTAAAALAAAKTALQGLSADEIRTSQNYVTKIDETAAAVNTFTQSIQGSGVDLDALEKVLLQKAADRDRAKPPATGRTPHRAVAVLAPAVRAQDAWLEAERVAVRVPLRTLRLQKFINLVAANNIRRFTKYSVDNWLVKPGEFFAEAYSLWLTDPDFLKTNYLVVFNFFESGDYRR